MYSGATVGGVMSIKMPSEEIVFFRPGPLMIFIVTWYRTFGTIVMLEN